MKTIFKLVILLVLIAVLGSACAARDEELNVDVEMQYVIVGYNDYYTSDESQSFVRLNANLGTALQGTGDYQRATDPNNSNVSAAGVPAGKLIGFDEGNGFGKVYEELKVVDENSDLIIQLSQTEEGLVNNSENLQVYYGGQVIAQLFERENLGEDREVESIEFREDGNWVGVAQVEELGFAYSREAIRDGTIITDYENEFIYETKFQTAPGVFIPAGSEVYVDGTHVLDIVPKVLESKVGWLIFDGFEIKDLSGRIVCQYVIADEFSATSYAYEFSCGGDNLGKLFVETVLSTTRTHPNGSYCYGDSGCSVTYVKVSYLLEGSTLEEKLDNLKVIDYVMALMPDQVNMNSNLLHELEEMTDVVTLLLLEPTGMEAVKYGINLSQEEDGLMVFDAYTFIEANYMK